MSNIEDIRARRDEHRTRYPWRYEPGAKDFIAKDRDDLMCEVDRLREALESAENLLAELDLDSSRSTAPGTAWGSILRAARVVVHRGLSETASAVRQMGEER